ncbi:MAG: hypothetical protein J7L73_02140, partial [Anaerolineales bacterium]|nr:hypothetical protein [Anaerolineales bacterium]
MGRMIIEAFPVPPSLRVRRLLIALLFLPGLHFWTCAIGKDSLIFFGITLYLWSLLNLKTRWLGYVVGFGVTFLIRPHIAAFLLIATVMGIFSGRMKWRWRILGLLAGIVVCILTIPLVMNYLHLDS